MTIFTNIPERLFTKGRDLIPSLFFEIIKVIKYNTYSVLVFMVLLFI